MKEKNSKKLFYLLLLFYFCYNAIRASRIVILKSQDSEFVFSWRRFLFDNLLIEPIYSILFILAVLFLTKYMLKRKINPYLIFGLHFLFFLITIVLLYLIYDGLNYLRGDTKVRTLNYYFINIISYSNVHFLIYFVYVFIIYSYYYIEELKEAEIQKLTFKDQLSQVRVNILKYQLHPHFFFNTLNSISSLIETNKTLAQNTLADFSDLLRDIVYLKDTNFLSLSIELGILKRYIDIMKIRFSNDLIINLNVEDNIDKVLIPSLIMQPILENSFKFGYSSEKTNLKIDISIKRINKDLEIIIENNGAPLPKNVKYGNGLKNTVERLKTLYGENYHFSILNISGDKGVVTKLVFPIKFENSTKQ